MNLSTTFGIKIALLFLSLTLILGLPFAHGQRRGRNISIQLGYQTKLLNPRPFNFALDSLANGATPAPTESFERIRWTPGLAGGIAYHRGNLNLRVHYNAFEGSSNGVALDSLGVETLQSEAQISGWNIGFHFSSTLIRFSDYGGVSVGGSFQISRIETALAQAPLGTPLPDFTNISRVTKPSFSIILPFRYGPIPRVQLSVEPYFQVFFSPTNFRRFSEAFNGPRLADANSGRLIGEMDHFGVNAQVIFYLLPE